MLLRLFDAKRATVRAHVFILMFSVASCRRHPAHVPETSLTTAKSHSAPAPPLSWLVGTWRNADASAGTEAEEIWERPIGGAMLGSFRLIKEGQPRFYEFMVLAQSAAETLLILRHFDPNLTAWEDTGTPLQYRLSKFAPGYARFDHVGHDPVRSIEYELESGGGLSIRLYREPHEKRSEFHFVKVARERSE